MTVLVRNVSSYLTSLDIVRGLPSIYLTWPGYDEVARDPDMTGPAVLIGSLLIVRGAMAGFMPNRVGAAGGLLVVGLTAVGIFYHARQRAPKN